MAQECKNLFATRAYIDIQNIQKSKLSNSNMHVAPAQDFKWKYSFLGYTVHVNIDEGHSCIKLVRSEFRYTDH